MSPQAAQVGSGFFYVIALGHDEQRLWRPYGADQQRTISRESVDLADLVTEMRLIKHPYKAGIKAQQGVGF
jgi:hypothetical protein